MTEWADDLSEDYHVAALRLATLTIGRVQHLLFGSIELYSPEAMSHRAGDARSSVRFPIPEPGIFDDG
jgi:hypothetical protein